MPRSWRATMRSSCAGAPPSSCCARATSTRVWACSMVCSARSGCGRWREALARCDAAERMFREDCVGAAWEAGTASQIAMSCLVYMGQYTELRPRLARALDEADRRGDLHTATEMRTALQPVLCLIE